MGLFSSKTKSTQTTTYDPRLMAYAYDTLNNFDTMYGGVRSRFADNPPSTYVAGFSPDTVQAQNMARGFAQSSTPADMRGLAGAIGTYRTDAARGMDPTAATNQAVSSALGVMGGLTQRTAPTFAPYQTLNADEVGAQTMQAAHMNAAQIANPAQIANAAQIAQAAQMSAAQVGGIDNITAQQGANFMGSYMNPYLQQVVDTSLADYDVGVDRQAAQNRARRDAGSAFGDRAAIADAVYSADSNRGRGAMAANLRSEAFNTAANFGMQDSNRFLEADRANQQTAQQRAMENARLQQAAYEANARMQQETYGTNAQLLQNTNDTNARLRQDTLSANARMLQEANDTNARMLQETYGTNARYAQEAAFKNTDTRNQFKLTNDQRLRDLEMQNFNAGLSNDEMALRAAQAQAGTAQSQNTTQASIAQTLAGLTQGQADILSSADAAELQRIAALAQAGQQIDARDQAMLDEAREYLLLRGQLMGQVPVESVRTEVNKKTPSIIDSIGQVLALAKAHIPK